jgi:Spy/CpxP family protein refolding chaperone
MAIRRPVPPWGPAARAAILAGFALGFAVTTGGAALAQATPSPTPAAKPAEPTQGASAADTITHLLRILDLQQKQLEQQEEQAEAQHRQIEELQRTIESLNRRLAELEAKAGVETPNELEERLSKLESKASEKPELPPDIVSAGNFPGSMRIPGTDAALKIGGQVWTSIVHTMDALGSDDRFLTYSIPIEGSAAAGKGPRLSLWAGPSKINFDVRTPTEVGQMRAFIESDFAGSSSYMRLRHAYLQYRSFLVGQTWSTFSDPDAPVEDLDFEGLNAENVTRQAQVRYFATLSGERRLAFAIEFPTASIAGGQSVNQVPDFIARMRWPRGEGHLQAAIVLRQIRGELDTQPNVTQGTFGWGVSTSGVVPVPAWDPADKVVFQFNGGIGIARYINDLNSAGGQDAIFIPSSGELRPLGAYGFYVDYEHHWRTAENLFGLTLPDLRSSLIWGHVKVTNLAEQPEDAYHQTDRLSLNLVFSPITSLDVGTEFIYGTRENKDHSRGRARQIQLRLRYLF